MRQRITLTQSSYFGGYTAFDFTRSHENREWTAQYYQNDIPLSPSEEDWIDVSHFFVPAWLNRTMKELCILDLKSESEIDLPLASVLDGLSFEIRIQKGRNVKKISYYHYFEFLGYYPDVWRADSLWRLLKSVVSKGLNG